MRACILVIDRSPQSILKPGPWHLEAYTLRRPCWDFNEILVTTQLRPGRYTRGRTCSPDTSQPCINSAKPCTWHMCLRIGALNSQLEPILGNAPQPLHINIDSRSRARTTAGPKRNLESKQFVTSTSRGYILLAQCHYCLRQGLTPAVVMSSRSRTSLKFLEREIRNDHSLPQPPGHVLLAESRLQAGCCRSSPHRDYHGNLKSLAVLSCRHRNESRVLPRRYGHFVIA